MICLKYDMMTFILHLFGARMVMLDMIPVLEMAIKPEVVQKLIPFHMREQNPANSSTNASQSTIDSSTTVETQSNSKPVTTPAS